MALRSPEEFQHFKYHQRTRRAGTDFTHGGPYKYDFDNKDWRKFWEEMRQEMHNDRRQYSSEEIRKRNEDQWDRIWKYTAIGLFLVLLYNVGYLMQVTNQKRYLDSLQAHEEIARSFLRQREFRDRMDDSVEVDNFARILKADIDAAQARKMEEMNEKGEKNSMEIREENRWMDAVRDVTWSPRMKRPE
ncbi:hypothetical protein L596_008681 [Steinernema carpocapsae]|uniref:Uncharacterized protein n=1 Tax=Steinernema carpocapsae TaxID=34508 RepID=A0A4U5PDB3_STECR|nr:hypothetical protein L596_008681 [Steinernema carpocapsae]